MPLARFAALSADLGGNAGLHAEGGQLGEESQAIGNALAEHMSLASVWCSSLWKSGSLRRFEAPRRVCRR